MKVKLINYTTSPIKTIYTAARTCYSSETPIDIWDKDIPLEKMYVLLAKTIDSGHHSILEHIALTFALEGISRACSHQLVRHRIASYSQQSQRYVKYDAPEFIYPEKVLADDSKKERYRDELSNLFKLYAEFTEAGLPQEDARFILPNATATNIVMTMNFRELYNVAAIRLCNRAQWEIREMFVKIKSEVENKDELLYLAQYLQPKCKHIGYCPEFESCGLMPHKNEVIDSDE